MGIFSSTLSSPRPSIDITRFPRGEGSTVTLPDERLIGYKSYGSTDENAPVILLFPGIPGSRFFHHPSIHTATEALSCRLIVLERPGFGLSSPKPGRTLVDWADDVEFLVDAFHIPNFSVLGYSAGGPYALSVAYKLHRRIMKVAIISSVAPRALDNDGDFTEGMPLKNRIAWWMCENAPRILSWIVAWNARLALKDPIHLYREDLDTQPETDREIALSPEVEAMFVESMLECYTRGQSGTEAEEYALWGKEWGFDLRQIPLLKDGIRVWQGDCDHGTTLPMGKSIAEAIGAEMVIGKGRGHWYYFTVWEEVVGWLAGR